ncbi:O-succinylbenzoate synthase [Actinoplanes octamycinicus]|uniref:o-succinylbenzoate synthase n=1 Tax=Actinoplanes octamycinicus TaxID=135948 RepID=A0A7W7H3T8_9ACTN|nr:o-succinylbenzoate synthase [Actinoplanes octamycinicus]MBB4743367.1 O-succinylbenzoate synthase [Actinoplanes octamycinicus]GIE61882.1 o-succinylbenzoate synthase [Actinoplanes octamycinicus]
MTGGTLPFDEVWVYEIPMRTRFRGLTTRQGVVVRAGDRWGEFCPFLEYDDEESQSWLDATIEACSGSWPAPVRETVPVNCIIPAVDPAQAHHLTRSSECRTAKVKVGSHPASLNEDLARVEAVRDALGPTGALRIDVNGAWDVTEAVRNIGLLDRSAGGLQYVEQPCQTIDELASVRRRVDVRIAADESIRRAADPLRVSLAGAADVAVVKCAPLGGVRRALEIIEQTGLPCVVSSALETSIGLVSELFLAAALPELDFACGLDTLALFEGDLTTAEGAIRPRAGVLRVPDRPPAPDPGLLARYRVADPVQEKHWLSRLSRLGAGSATVKP